MLETLKSWHNVDSVVIKDFFRVLRDHYRIPECYGVHTPWYGQQSYDQFLDGFGLTMGALEAGLQFPLHPVIEECLRKWEYCRPRWHRTLGVIW